MDIARTIKRKEAYSMSALDELLKNVPLPRVMKVSQMFDSTKLHDVEKTLDEAIRSNDGYQSIRPGMEIALTVGSRGITNLPLFVSAIVRLLKDKGAKAFIVPSMGSHGGATAKGQQSLLNGMGITERTVGAPIRATMETVQIATTGSGLPVMIDKYANEADGIVVFNRIKPHVAFRGPYESGLMKMIAIGLGKQRGADICHNLGYGSMAANIPAIANTVLKMKPVLFGVGVVENAYHQTHTIAVLNKDEIAEKGVLLQDLSKKLYPRILFDRLDVLIIDEIGKDISSTGFDTGVVGRYHTPFISGGPSITRMGVLDLTSRSHGNANGVGLADFTTRRLFDKFLPDQTYPNALTSTVPLTVKMPMVLDNDLQVFQAAIATCNIVDKRDVRLARIKNTVELDTIEVSENLRDEVLCHPDMHIASDPYNLCFDENGHLFYSQS